MSLFFSTRAAVMVSVMLGAALAHAGPRLALHPLVDLSDERGLDPAAESQIEFRKIARAAGLELEESPGATSFLKAHPKGCEGEGEALDICLGGLAKAAHAPAALLVRVYPYAGQLVVLSWAVVDESGLELAARRLQVEKQGSSKKAWIRAALKNFFETTELDPVKLRAALPKPVAEPPAAAPVPVAIDAPVKTPPATLVPKAPAIKPPSGSGPQWRRPVAIGLGAVGVLGLGAGLWLGSRSSADADSYRSLLERGQTAAQRDLLADLRDGSNQKAHLANLALVGGGGTSRGRGCTVHGGSPDPRAFTRGRGLDRAVTGWDLGRRGAALDDGARAPSVGRCRAGGGHGLHRAGSRSGDEGASRLGACGPEWIGGRDARSPV